MARETQGADDPTSGADEEKRMRVLYVLAVLSWIFYLVTLCLLLLKLNNKNKT